MHVTWMEVVLVSAALLIRDPWAFAVVPRHWPTMAAIGFTSWASSVCWFWAFSLTLVAYVRALGQIESVLAVGLGLFVFREPAAERQLPGVALLAAGILLVLLP